MTGGLIVVEKGGGEGSYLLRRRSFSVIDNYIFVLAVSLII